MRVVVIDNYDSFTYNLVQYVAALGAEVTVHRNDAVTLEQIATGRPDAIVISPGPGHPADPKFFGVSAAVLQKLSPEIPTLGVCLGMQGFASTYGAQVVHAPRLMHGKACQVRHDGKRLYRGLPNPVRVGRYHSLIVDATTLPPEIETTAWSDERELMGIRHKRYPIEGVQFHPESILTEQGMDMMRNFLEGST